jgi:hypothetical protein
MTVALNPRGVSAEEMDEFAEVDEQNVFGQLSDSVTGGEAFFVGCQGQFVPHAKRWSFKTA